MIYFLLTRSALSPLSYLLFYSLKQGAPGTLWVNHPELIEHPKLCRANPFTSCCLALGHFI